MVEEARLEKQDVGLTPVTDGWFVVTGAAGELEGLPWAEAWPDQLSVRLSPFRNR